MSDAETLRALARKYDALVELRRRRDAGGDAAGGGALRDLAKEFPGCLRELDTLGLRELERRAHASAAAAAGGPTEDWIDWIEGYHALMRAARAVRDLTYGGHEGGDGNGRDDEGHDDESGDEHRDAATVAALATAATGVTVEVSFVGDVLAPPGGRVGVVVLRALAARFDVPAATIAATLFPVRRPSPYAL